MPQKLAECTGRTEPKPANSVLTGGPLLFGDAASTPAMQHARPLLQSGLSESKHQKVFPVTPSLGLRGHGTAGAATTRPVFQAVSARWFQVAPGGHSSGTTFLAGLILGRMRRHAQQPQAAPGPQPGLLGWAGPPCRWALGEIAALPALLWLLLPETFLKLTSAHREV